MSDLARFFPLTDGLLREAPQTHRQMRLQIRAGTIRQHQDDPYEAVRLLFNDDYRGAALNLRYRPRE